MYDYEPRAFTGHEAFQTVEVTVEFRPEANGRRSRNCSGGGIGRTRFPSLIMACWQAVQWRDEWARNVIEASK